MKGPKMAKPLMIFTQGYRPFVMGGSTTYWLGMLLENPPKPVALGKGFKGYVITAPNGSTVVAEATTGAIVGNYLETVKEDIKQGTKERMTAQVAQAQGWAKEVVEVAPKEFWGKMGML